MAFLLLSVFVDSWEIYTTVFPFSRHTTNERGNSNETFTTSPFF